MILLQINYKKFTNINNIKNSTKLTRITYIKMILRFFPGSSNNFKSLISGVNMLIPKPSNIVFCIPNAVSIRCMTRLCPKIIYPHANLRKSAYDRIDKTSFMQNKELDDILTQICVSRDSTVIVKNEIEFLIKNLLEIENNLRIKNYDIEDVQNYLKFLSEHPLLQYNVDYQHTIIPFFDFLKNNNLSTETQKTLKNFFKKYIKDKKENYLEEIKKKYIVKPENETLIQKEVREFLDKKINSRCFLEQDFNDNISIMKNGLEILEKYKYDLTDKQFIDLLVHLKVCKYAHVYDLQTDENKNKIFNIFYNAGDLKIDKSAFKYYSIDMSNISTNIISKEDFQILIEKVNQKDIEIGTLNINRDLPQDTLIISAQDLHLNVSVSVNGTRYLLGFFTSTIDEETLVLSRLQEINDNPKEQNKLQMFRPGNRLIEIADENFVLDKKATDYARDVSRNSLILQEDGKVFDKIITGIKKQEQNLQNNYIGIPVIFTKNNLCDIAKKFIDDLIKKYEIEKDYKFKSLSGKKKTKNEEKKDLYEKQKNNNLKEQEEIEFRRSLSQFDRSIYDALQILKEKKPNKDLANISAQQPFIEDNNTNTQIIYSENNI